MNLTYKIFIIEENGCMPENIEALLAQAGYVINYASTGLDGAKVELLCSAGEVTVRGAALDLTSTEYGILELMLKSPSKVFSKTNIFESVWGETYFCEDNTVNVHMSNLRSKLRKANADQHYIQTVWGQGYRLAC